MFNIFDSVDSVVKDFNNVVNRLNKLKVARTDEAEELEVEAAVLLDAARDNRREANRADKIANKISKLLEE